MCLKIYPEIKQKNSTSVFSCASSQVKKGQMTLASIFDINKAFNTSIIYYNEEDRHLNPKSFVKTTPDIVLFIIENTNV